MKKLNKFLAVLLSIIICISLVSVYTGADDSTTSNEETVTVETASYINPLYADILSEDDLDHSIAEMSLADSANGYIDTIEEAGSVLREGFKAREETTVITVDRQNGYFVGMSFEEIYGAIIAEALIETDDPECGDYLRYQYGGSSGGGRQTSVWCEITFNSVYYTTAAQEEVVSDTVDDVIGSLDLAGKDEDYKIAKIYDYITSNVVYDYDNLGNQNYLLQYTAYAALINGTSVCQGYANLFYRLCREAGLSTRIISGTGNGGAHAWNIVRIGSLYYNVDSTWDAGDSPAQYAYFLKCDNNFTGHVRGGFDDDVNYTSAAFYAAYPMSETDYGYPESAKKAVTGLELSSTALTILPSGTCTITAEVLPADAFDRTVTWSFPDYSIGFDYNYDDTFIEIIPGGNVGYIVVKATTNDGNFSKSLKVIVSNQAHVHTEEILSAVPATCTEPGLTEGKKCSACGEILVEQEEIPALGHDYVPHDGKDATCTEVGWEAYDTCSRCDYTTYVEIPAHGHTEEIIPGTPATCYLAGITDGKKCSVCGEMLEAQEEIPALGHDLVHHNGKDPTCTEHGWYSYDACSRCNYSTYAVIPPAGHNEMTMPAVPATCTETGLTEGKRCMRCREILVAQEVVPALGHSYDENGVCTVCGAPKDGWIKTDDGIWHYYKDGVITTGWQKVGGTWYYMDNDGNMLTGWQKIGGTWYYFKSGGQMVTGWQKISGTWYYFKSGGAMVKGWQKIDNKWYYFKSSGAMAANEWCEGYWLNKDGSWTYQPKGSWKQDSRGWWFGDTSGWYAKNTTIKIDNKNYTFNASGYWVK